MIFENSSPHRLFGEKLNTKFRFCRRILDISGQWLLMLKVVGFAATRRDEQTGYQAPRKRGYG